MTSPSGTGTKDDIKGKDETIGPDGTVLQCRNETMVLKFKLRLQVCAQRRRGLEECGS
jgi:hypothetical protein